MKACRIPFKGFSADVIFKVATGRQDLRDAFRILHDVYVETGFISPQPSKMRITLFHAIPTTSTLVAVHQNKVVATASIVRDSRFGLPMEKVFDLGALRNGLMKCAEISGLAIHEDYRKGFGRNILFPLLKYIFEYSYQFFGVDILLATIHPKDLRFYQGILGFSLVNDQTVDYLGAPARAVSIHLKESGEILAGLHGTDPIMSNPYYYFMKVQPPSTFVYPERIYFNISDPAHSPDDLYYFFIEQSAVIQNLSDEEYFILKSYYCEEKYDSILPWRGTQHKSESDLRHQARFEVKCKGQIKLSSFSKPVRMQVLDVSEFGFKAELQEVPVLRGEFDTQIEVADFKIAQLTAYPVWLESHENGGVMGFRVFKCDATWNEFIEYLTQKGSTALKKAA